MNNLLYSQILKSKINVSFGYDFQYLFFEILKCLYADNFIMPKPQGRYGDRKNDGYIPSEGKYFAIYGPETYDLNVAYTCQKMEDDLTGLLDNIKNGNWTYEVKSFVFVINTRYNKIVPVEINQKVEELHNKTGIDVVLWTSYDIEILFNKLSDNEKQFVLQCYTTLDNFSLNIQVLNSIIEKISVLDFKKSKIDGLMEFEDKIKFNNISDDRSADLLAASYNISSLDSVLDELDSTGMLQEELSNLLKNIYENSKNKFSNENQIFDNIICELMKTSSDDLSQINIKIIRETVLIIMSKYFENCTIFEKGGIK